MEVNHRRGYLCLFPLTAHRKHNTCRFCVFTLQSHASTRASVWKRKVGWWNRNGWTCDAQFPLSEVKQEGNGRRAFPFFRNDIEEWHFSRTEVVKLFFFFFIRWHNSSGDKCIIMLPSPTPVSHRHLSGAHSTAVFDTAATFCLTLCWVWESLNFHLMLLISVHPVLMSLDKQNWIEHAFSWFPFMLNTTGF